MAADIEIHLVVDDRTLLDPTRYSGLTEEAEEQLGDAVRAYGHTVRIEQGF